MTNQLERLIFQQCILASISAIDCTHLTRIVRVRITLQPALQCTMSDSAQFF